MTAATVAVAVGGALGPHAPGGRGGMLGPRNAVAGQLSGMIELSDVGTGVAGVRFNGTSGADFSGQAVSSAGDVSGVWTG